MASSPEYLEVELPLSSPAPSSRGSPAPELSAAAATAASTLEKERKLKEKKEKKERRAALLAATTAATITRGVSYILFSQFEYY